MMTKEENDIVVVVADNANNNDGGGVVDVDDDDRRRRRATSGTATDDLPSVPSAVAEGPELTSRANRQYADVVCDSANAVSPLNHDVDADAEDDDDNDRDRDGDYRRRVVAVSTAGDDSVGVVDHTDDAAKHSQGDDGGRDDDDDNGGGGHPMLRAMCHQVLTTQTTCVVLCASSAYTAIDVINTAKLYNLRVASVPAGCLTIMPKIPVANLEVLEELLIRYCRTKSDEERGRAIGDIYAEVQLERSEEEEEEAKQKKQRTFKNDASISKRKAANDAAVPVAAPGLGGLIGGNDHCYPPTSEAASTAAAVGSAGPRSGLSVSAPLSGAYLVHLCQQAHDLVDINDDAEFARALLVNPPFHMEALKIATKSVRDLRLQGILYSDLFDEYFTEHPNGQSEAAEGATDHQTVVGDGASTTTTTTSHQQQSHMMHSSTLNARQAIFDDDDVDEDAKDRQININHNNGASTTVAAAGVIKIAKAECPRCRQFVPVSGFARHKFRCNGETKASRAAKRAKLHEEDPTAIVKQEDDFWESEEGQRLLTMEGVGAQGTEVVDRVRIASSPSSFSTEKNHEGKKKTVRFAGDGDTKEKPAKAVFGSGGGGVPAEYLREADYDIIDRPAEGGAGTYWDPDSLANGSYKIAAIFIKNAVPSEARLKATQALEAAATTSNRRHLVNGGVPPETGIVGFYDYLTNPIQKKCRETEFTRENWPTIADGCKELIKILGNTYKQHAPVYYRAQQRACPPQYQLFDSVFSTLTVNRNFRTACHTDSGDFKGGLGVVTVTDGDYGGCYLAIPKLKKAFNMRPGDVVLFDTSLEHGNTEIRPAAYKRRTINSAKSAASASLFSASTIRTTSGAPSANSFRSLSSNEEEEEERKLLLGTEQQQQQQQDVETIPKQELKSRKSGVFFVGDDDDDDAVCHNNDDDDKKNQQQEEGNSDEKKLLKAQQAASASASSAAAAEARGGSLSWRRISLVAYLRTGLMSHRCEQEYRKQLNALAPLVPDENGLVDINAAEPKLLSPLIMPKKVRLALQEVQMSALSFATNRLSRRSGCVIAMAMGLGKTLVGLLLAFNHLQLHKDADVLIVTPKSVISHWQNELMKWKKKGVVFPRTIIVGTTGYSTQMLNWQQQVHGHTPKCGHVFIVNPEGLRPLLTKNAKFNPSLIIVDEGHKVSNTNSSFKSVLERMTTPRRVVLTGTPMQNNAEELYDLVEWIDPDLVNTMPRSTFVASSRSIGDFINTGANASFYKAIEQQRFLLEWQKGFVFRVKDLNLPPLRDYIVVCGTSELQDVMIRDNKIPTDSLPACEHRPFHLSAHPLCLFRFMFNAAAAAAADAMEDQSASDDGDEAVVTESDDEDETTTSSSSSACSGSCASDDDEENTVLPFSRKRKQHRTEQQQQIQRTSQKAAATTRTHPTRKRQGDDDDDEAAALLEKRLDTKVKCPSNECNAMMAIRDLRTHVRKTRCVYEEGGADPDSKPKKKKIACPFCAKSLQAWSLETHVRAGICSKKNVEDAPLSKAAVLAMSLEKRLDTKMKCRCTTTTNAKKSGGGGGGNGCNEIVAIRDFHSHVRREHFVFDDKNGMKKIDCPLCGLLLYPASLRPHVANGRCDKAIAKEEALLALKEDVDDVKSELLSYSDGDDDDDVVDESPKVGDVSPNEHRSKEQAQSMNDVLRTTMMTCHSCTKDVSIQNLRKHLGRCCADAADQKHQYACPLHCGKKLQGKGIKEHVVKGRCSKVEYQEVSDDADSDSDEDKSKPEKARSMHDVLQTTMMTCHTCSELVSIQNLRKHLGNGCADSEKKYLCPLQCGKELRGEYIKEHVVRGKCSKVMYQETSSEKARSMHDVLQTTMMTCHTCSELVSVQNMRRHLGSGCADSEKKYLCPLQCGKELRGEYIKEHVVRGECSKVMYQETSSEGDDSDSSSDDDVEHFKEELKKTNENDRSGSSTVAVTEEVPVKRKVRGRPRKHLPVELPQQQRQQQAALNDQRKRKRGRPRKHFPVTPPCDSSSHSSSARPKKKDISSAKMDVPPSSAAATELVVQQMLLVLEESYGVRPSKTSTSHSRSASSAAAKPELIKKEADDTPEDGLPSSSRESPSVLGDEVWQSPIGQIICHSGKLRTCVEIIARAVKNKNEKVVVFSQYIIVQEFLEMILSTIGFNTVLLRGRDSHATRGKKISDFNSAPASRLPVCIVSTKVGAYGIDLTSANHVILIDSWWNPQVDQQAVARCYRRNQTRPVTVYRLVTRSEDGAILRTQQRKIALFRSLIDGVSSRVAASAELEDVRGDEEELRYGRADLWRCLGSKEISPLTPPPVSAVHQQGLHQVDDDDDSCGFSVSAPLDVDVENSTTKNDAELARSARVRRSQMGKRQHHRERSGGRCALVKVMRYTDLVQVADNDIEATAGNTAAASSSSDTA